MIKIENLYKAYGELQVLSGINLHIKQGEIFGLVGRSGTGKSTLLRCINGLERYQSGSLKVDHVQVSSLAPKPLRLFRKDVGMIFQQFSLLGRMTVYENIALPMKCWRYPQKMIDARVRHLLDIIGIPEKLHARTNELSGGQKQRVAIARALAMEPKVLLCDEATSSLDPVSTQSVIDLLTEVNRNLGITIVIVTHEMAVVRSICQEIAVMENGVLEAQGTVEAIFQQKPKALVNLLGDKSYALPRSGVNIELLVTEKSSSEPIISRMAKDLDIDFSVVGGELDSYKGVPAGTLVLNIAKEHIELVRKYLNDKKVLWRLIESNEIKEN